MTSSVDPDSPRFLRQRVLIGFGAAAQRALAEATVLVIGAGGLGSAVIPALAAAGVGTIAIIDDDTVEVSNLARQTIHGVADIERPKVDSAADAVARLSPDTTVIRHNARFVERNSFELLLDADILIDCSDNFATRYLANDAAEIRGIPLVWGSAAEYTGQVGVAWDEKGVDYRDLFPVQPDDDAALSCELVGVLPTVCGVIGAMMAGEVLKLITGIGEPLLGRVASSLADSVLIPLGQLPDRLDELDRNASIVVYCHHGVRSARALEVLEKAGFIKVRHLTGGIDAWRAQVDPEMAAY